MLLTLSRLGKEEKNSYFWDKFMKSFSPLCSDASSVGQRPSSLEPKEVLDSKESHERQCTDQPTTPWDRETTDELVHGEVPTESLQEPGILEVPKFSSEATVSASIMEAMSETTVPC